MISRTVVGVVHTALLAGLLAGCDAPATQLVAVVDSDFRVPDEVARLDVSVRSSTGTEISSVDFTLTGEAARTETRFPLPLSFGVVPEEGDASRRIRLEVEALDRDGEWVASRSARTGFIEGETLLLPMFLLRSCRSVRCPAGFTCGADGCESDEVDPGDLDPIEPGEELEVDGGKAGRTDAGVDAGPADAGEMRDAGVDDGGTNDAAMPLDATVMPDGGRDGGPPDATGGDTVLLDDGFEDGELTGWSTSGPGTPWMAQMEERHTGSWALRASATGAGDPALVEHPVEGGCTGVLRFEYWRKLVGLDGVDDFAARYRAGSWVDVERLGGERADDAGFVFQSFVIPSSSTHIGFLCEAGAASESCTVDAVRLVCE